MTYTLKDLWNWACKLDGIDPDSKFVVFSKENHWAKKYNTLLRLRAIERKRREEQAQATAKWKAELWLREYWRSR